jgi:hypothetical protein
MAKTPVRAKSATSARPDATLFALVEECLEVEARHRAAGDILMIADERKNEPKPPREVLRTESDLQLNLFVGSSLGSPYSEDEIKALRVFCRSNARSNISSNDRVDAYFRALAIIRAWAAWQDKIREEEERSGYAKAEAADIALADEHDALLSQIALARPTAAMRHGWMGMRGTISPESFRNYGRRFTPAAVFLWNSFDGARSVFDLRQAEFCRRSVGLLQRDGFESYLLQVSRIETAGVAPAHLYFHHHQIMRSRKYSL